MAFKKRTPFTNRLLAALPRKDRQNILAGCEEIDLVYADVLYEPEARIRHVYFPTDSFISLITQIDENAKLEVGMIGNEGMLGVSLLLGVSIAPLHAVVQGAGPALRMSSVAFCRELTKNPALQRQLNRYLYVLMDQLGRMAACSGTHVVEARLARWLLMTRDRAHSDKFRLTHEFLASMLSVRRVGVTKAAGSLQIQKLISYNHGDITILDRKGLEAAACGCYLTSKNMYDRILD